MNEAKKLGQTMSLAPFMLSGPGNPSDILRKHEARMISRLAEEAHLSGRRFAGWPTIKVDSRIDPWSGGFLTLHMEVVTV